MNLRNRIMVPTVTVITLLTASVAAVSFFTGKAMLRQVMDGQLAQTSRNILNDVEQWEGTQLNLLQSWATDSRLAQALQNTPEGAKAAQETCQMLTHGRDAFGYAEVINLADAKGLVVAGTDPGAIGKVNVAERSYFKDSMAGRVGLSDVIASRTTGHPCVVLSVPVKAGETVIGVVFTVLDLGRFSEGFVSSVKVLQTGYVYMYDANGLVMAHPDKTKILNVKIDDFVWGKQLKEQKNGQIDYTFDGVDKRVVFCTSEKLRWGVALTVPLKELNAPVKQLTTQVGILGILSVVLGVVVVLFTAVSITRPVERVTGVLSSGAEQISDSAGQVAGASQSLADSASQQAASLEEISSSLEEMMAMTRRNVESAGKASELARQARVSADDGASEMGVMNEAMHAIQDSSSEIAKIIKTIDEIAFQTNILALNAAVEAARAGEAGMGFAVVADEVRNLAQRCAQAAHETSDKIESAISKTSQGAQISSRVTTVFQRIIESIRQVDSLAAEVAEASKEQSQGIGQVTTSINEMDKVTQNTAANAEEGAAAAQELSAQAKALETAVEDLLALSGTHQKAESQQEQPQAAPARAQAQQVHSQGKSRALPNSKGKGQMIEM